MAWLRVGDYQLFMYDSSISLGSQKSARVSAFHVEKARKHPTACQDDFQPWEAPPTLKGDTIHLSGCLQRNPLAQSGEAEYNSTLFSWSLKEVKR
jgi:hypothetical protein